MRSLNALRFVLALVLAFGGVGVTWAVEISPGVLAGIGKRLGSTSVLRGEFEQTKTLKGFKRPLVSRGSFAIARAQGVQWLTSQPFASTLVLTTDRLTTFSETGLGQKTDVRQEPGLRAFNEILMALLMGDVKVLAARFKVEGGVSDAQGWRLVLEPRDAALATMITRIEIEGDRHVNGVQIHEASGDTSRIQFFNHKSTALTPLEIGRFGL